jgi:hypothetical protein
MLINMDKWLKDILPDEDPYHNRESNQMRKKGGPAFECYLNTIFRSSWYHFSFKIINWRLFFLFLAFSPKGFQSHHYRQIVCCMRNRHRPKSSTTFRGILIKILYLHSQVKKFQNDIYFICNCINSVNRDDM